MAAPTGYPARIVAAVAIGGAAFLLWQVRDVFILVFAAIVLAVVLNALSRPLRKRLRLATGLSVSITVLALLVMLALLAWLVGDRLAEEAGQLITTLPAAWKRVRELALSAPAGAAVLDALGNFAISDVTVQRLTGFATTTFGAVANLILVFFAAVFLASEPRLYVGGLVRLVPPAKRGATARALIAAGRALRRWLTATGLSMLCVGVVTGAGLWLLGIPLAFSLGILAGVLEFVPFLGPILAALPAVLVAFTVGPASAMQVALLYVIVQQLEGNLLVPLLQRWTVALPRALAIVAVMVFGVLFGLAGILFATPLMVVAMVLVRRLYVEGALEARMRDVPRHTPC